MTTLAEAKAKVIEWETADARVSVGQSYTINTRSYTRADIAEIRNQLTYWRRAVKELTAVQNGASRGDFMVAKWN